MVAPSPAPFRTIQPPRRFGAGALLVCNLYGLLVGLPVLLAVLVVSCVQFGAQTFLLPLVTIGAASFWLPLGLGNPHVSRIVRGLRPGSDSDQRAFVVQATLRPRIRSGLRALLEDADDVGWLSVNETALVFEGDSLQLSLPWSQVEAIQPRSIGWRGLFLYGPRVRLSVAGVPNLTEVEFAERSSWIVPTSRKTARLLYQALANGLRTARGR